MDIRDKKISWRDQEVFDIPEAAGVTASGDFLVVIRDKLIEQLNHLTIVNQFIPDLQKEVSILDIYLNRGGEKPKVRQWETDRITKQKELDDLIARKEVLLMSIPALQRIMESILWELKE